MAGRCPGGGKECGGGDVGVGRHLQQIKGEARAEPFLTGWPIPESPLGLMKTQVDPQFQLLLLLVWGEAQEFAFL